MGMVVDITGKQFGRLTVLAAATSPAAANRRGIWWRCACSCGNTKVLYGGDIRGGDTQSCGCLNREQRALRAGNRTRTHGRSGESIYSIWDSMLQRCENPKRKDYPRYGGRGITVCARWRDSFDAFLADMGDRPSTKHSIDRRDGDGNYEPSNCRWATATEQARNHRGNRLVTLSGKTQCLIAWCEELGISKATVNGRRSRGWSIEAALSTPPDQTFNWRK